MSSHDPHPTRARDRGLRRMQAVRRWAVALTTAAALALSGLAWASTPQSTNAHTTGTSSNAADSSSSDSGSPSSATGTSWGDSGSTPSSTTRTPSVTSGGS